MRLWTRILLCCLCCPLLVPQIGAAGPRAAVIVGVSDYPDGSNIPDLQFAARDAQNFSAFVKERGYQQYTLIDDEATGENLRRGIEIFARNAIQEPFEQLIFYFSGRGTRVIDERLPPDEDKDGYDECLLLSDATAGQEETYLRDDELLQLMARIKAHAVLLILDCSFHGEPEDASVKGLGAVPGEGLDGVSPVKEGDVDSIQNTLVLSASEAEEGAVDGVLMPALLVTLDAEEADTTGDRQLSVGEIHQHIKSMLSGRQTPQLFDPWQLNPVPVVLPPLPTLQITSDPAGAEVFIVPENRAASRLPLSEAPGRRRFGRTPLQLELKKGKYRVTVQKLGFRRPTPQEIDLAEYDKAYTLEPFALSPISIHGTVLDERGIAVGNPMVRFQQGEKIVDQKAADAYGTFRPKPDEDTWLQLGQEYTVTVTGRQVLTANLETFTFTGYEDIHLDLRVTLDTTPPELVGVDLSTSRTVPAKNVVLPGDEILLTVMARDDGLGVEAVSLTLGQLGTERVLNLDEPKALGEQQSSEEDRKYVFRHPIAGPPDDTERWQVARIQLTDSGGNSRIYAAGEINIGFTAFPNALAMGESYFQMEAYTQALAAFDLAETETDHSRYLTTLVHDALQSTQKAVDTFLTITDQATYLGNRPPDLAPMPRSLLNRLWGHYLDELPQNRQNPVHLNLLAVAAKALNRPDQAKLYQAYREKLLTTLFSPELGTNRTYS